MSGATKDEVTVIDDFLSEQDFSAIENIMMSDQFPWYYNSMILGGGNKGLDDYQFAHIFFIDFSPCSSLFGQIIAPIINTIKPSAVIRAKANLNARTEKNIEHGFHVDTFNESRTGILYINDCDGYTLFEKSGERVYSKRNRFASFDSSLSHSSASQTDSNVRIVININYHEAKRL